MKRINNATYCCNEIQELLESYKEKYNSLRVCRDINSRIKSELYCKVILDLEKILYGESSYDY